MASFSTKTNTRFMVGDHSQRSSSEAILTRLHEKAKARKRKSLEQASTDTNSSTKTLAQVSHVEISEKAEETPTKRGAGEKTKKKKTSAKKKSLPPKVILKKLYAKARDRETAIKARDSSKEIEQSKTVEQELLTSSRSELFKTSGTTTQKTPKDKVKKKKKKLSAASSYELKSELPDEKAIVEDLEESPLNSSCDVKVAKQKVKSKTTSKTHKRSTIPSDSKRAKKRKVDESSSGIAETQSSEGSDEEEVSSLRNGSGEDVNKDGSSDVNNEDESVNNKRVKKIKKSKKGDVIIPNEDDGNHSNVTEEMEIGVDVEEDDDTEVDVGQRSKSAISEDEIEDEQETAEDFTILGDKKNKKKQKVTRVLPDWLAHPMLIEHDLQKHSVDVDKMKQLDSLLVKRLQDDGVMRLFPVQRHVIPVILDSVKLGIQTGDVGYRPRDVCVSAPTGSGKTLAFAIPIVQALLYRVVPRIRALVVLPTRDLAQQVHKVFTSLCKGTSLKAALVGGLKKFGQEQRMLVETSNGETQCDIVVATPGRLVDHINKTRGFSLQHLRFLVIDEADRMMDQISQDWIAQVEKCAYKDSRRQTPGPITVASCSKIQMPLQKLLFSATLSQNPEKLTQLNLFQPRLITSVVTSKNRRKQKQVDGQEALEERGEFVGKFTTPFGLKERYIQCTPGEKPLVVLHLIQSLKLSQILCFANTIESTHRLYHLLKLIGGIEVAEFSSNQTAGQRRQILKQFKAGKIELLICSDAMARGMDIENARYVISYDMPPYIKTYIHRVGRTARAGKTGVAYSLLQEYEVPKLLKMLEHAGKTNMIKHDIEEDEMEYLVESYEKALQKLPTILRVEKHYSM
ncbi:ATP-dependent RNA helicase DDX51-like [Asterias amurensis]|uniref:ATP-dependent RNA helicase DDX51-like n=1 Tax=Asterias amurensis TaxID=7602 RepID=UPI003AB523BE